MNVLRKSDSRKVQMDFLVHSGVPGDFHNDTIELGSSVLVCDGLPNPFTYALNFLKILKRYGPYEVVHVHVHHFSALPLLLSRLAGVKVRIAHSHSDSSPRQINATFLRRLYYRFTARLISLNANVLLAGNGESARALFPYDWSNRSRVQILRYGIDLNVFGVENRRHELRAAFGIPLDAVVIGHVGRFVEVKNHLFLISIFNQIHSMCSNSYLVMVGTGPLQSEIADQIRSKPWHEKAIFAGVRDDVPDLLQHVFDCLVLPSYYEGMPIAVLEAQAAGLRSTISDTITRDVQVVPDGVRFVSLELPAARWAELILQSGFERIPNSLSVMKDSPFDAASSARAMMELYSRYVITPHSAKP